MENKGVIIRKTRAWLKQFVIGLGLCPFAKKPFELEKIRYVVCPENSLDKLTKQLLDELYFLGKAQPSRIETTLIIIPYQLETFKRYNNYLTIVDEVLRELNLIGEIQVASFHPDYQFEGTQPEDAENYTNRSPYPMLHLLREDSISQAVKNYPDPKNIPQRNIEKMKTIGIEKLKQWKDEINE